MKSKIYLYAANFINTMNFTTIGTSPAIDGKITRDPVSSIEIANNGNTPTLTIEFTESSKRSKISVPYSQVRLDGSTPASQSAALIALDELFPKANSSTGGSGNGVVTLS